MRNIDTDCDGELQQNMLIQRSRVCLGKIWEKMSKYVLCDIFTIKSNRMEKMYMTNKCEIDKY